MRHRPQQRTHRIFQLLFMCLEPISKLKKQYYDEALSGQVHLVDRKIPKEMMVSRSLTSVRVIGILACNRF